MKVLVGNLSIRRALLLLLLTALAASFASGKDAGDLLAQYLDRREKPGQDWASQNEILALAEIVSVDIDRLPEGNWKQSGTLRLRLLEAVREGIPQTFSVRFFKRHAEGIDAWTWDDAQLSTGRRLLGFFFADDKGWAVRLDGRHNVINNPENIQADLLKRVQPLFKTKL
jgi:hypothetical protein